MMTDRAVAKTRAWLLAAVALLSSGMSAALAAEAVTPQHLERIEALQRRADILAFGGTGSGNYQLAKARTWLDFALSEYYVMDGSGIVSAAIEKSEVLLDSLEQERTHISPDTQLQAPGSEVVRSDLGQEIAALKNDAHFSCGQRHLAEAEVYFVWASHEEAEYGMSHAEPYLQAAESRIFRARAAIDDCAASAAAMQASPPPPERTILPGDAVFDFGKAAISPSALRRIDAFFESVSKWKYLERVELIGHSDHLSRDGRQTHNLLLSRQRAESIRNHLVARGIPEGKISARGAGSTRPLVKCPEKQARASKIACLQPNRRVEIVLHGIK